MTIYQDKFFIILSSLFSTLIFFLLFQTGFFSGVEQLILLIVISGLILGLLIKETVLIQYSKSALCKSLIFGLIFGIINGTLIFILDRNNGFLISNLPGVIIFLSCIGFVFGFFGMLATVILNFFRVKI